MATFFERKGMKILDPHGFLSPRICNFEEIKADDLCNPLNTVGTLGFSARGYVCPWDIRKESNPNRERDMGLQVGDLTRMSVVDFEKKVTLKLVTDHFPVYFLEKPKICDDGKEPVKTVDVYGRPTTEVRPARKFAEAKVIAANGQIFYLLDWSFKASWIKINDLPT